MEGTMLQGEIPVIDFGAKHGDVVKAVAQACRDWGFFQVVNHGVPVSSTQGILELAKAFADLPQVEKQACNADTAWKGVLPIEPFRYTGLGEGSSEWRESLRVTYAAKNYSIWPQSPSSFKDVMMEYMENVRRFTQHLLGIISEGLGLDPGSVENTRSKDPRHFFTLSIYPPFDKPEGIPPHSDMGWLTVLLQDSVGGLEANTNGHWFPVTPIKNAFVINLGDQMEILTNGDYKSIMHRVQLNPIRRRISVASFYGPGLDEKCAPLAELLNETTPPLFRECTMKDYMKHFISRQVDGKTCLDYFRITT